MITDEKIIEMFFERSEQAIRELDDKYKKICHALSRSIVGDRQDAEECVNDAYFGAWNAIPPVKPNPLRHISAKLSATFPGKATIERKPQNETASILLSWKKWSPVSQAPTL